MPKGKASGTEYEDAVRKQTFTEVYGQQRGRRRNKREDERDTKESEDETERARPLSKNNRPQSPDVNKKRRGGPPIWPFRIPDWETGWLRHSSTSLYTQITSNVSHVFNAWAKNGPRIRIPRVQLCNNTIKMFKLFVQSNPTCSPKISNERQTALETCLLTISF